MRQDNDTMAGLDGLVARRGRGFLSFDEISALYDVPRHEDIARDVSRLVRLGKIAPVRSAGVVAHVGDTELRAKYRIVPEPGVAPPDMAGAHPRIADAPWIARHPREAREHEDFLWGLSDVLAGRRSLAGFDPREAGYALARDEKAFQKGTGRPYLTILSRLKIGLDELGVVDSPWPPTMETYGGVGPVVVSENLTPYNRLRVIPRRPADAEHAFGFLPAAVVFGGGDEARRPNPLDDARTQAGLAEGAEFLYWGDIDREGVRILNDAAARNPTVALRPWASAYHVMLEAARRRLPRESADRRDLEMPDLSLLEACLAPDDMALLRSLLRDGRIVPQESVLPAHYTDGALR